MKKTIIFFLLILNSCIAYADAVAFKDYRLIRRGMTEAEVLYRLGPFDRETVRSDRFNAVLSKIWFYIPNQRNSNKWITELRFNSSGVLVSTDRYRIR